MEEVIYVDYSSDLNKIYDELYNINVRVNTINQVLVNDVSSSSAIVAESVVKINSTVDILTIMFMMFFVFSMIKLRRD